MTPSEVRVVYMGSASFAVPSLQRLVEAGYAVPLVVTRVDKPSGRGLEVSETPVKQAARALGLPVFQPRTLRDEAVHQVLRDAAPDVIVVAAYGRILPPEVLAIPPRGCVNVHGSLLPKYRGAAPIQWSVIRGERETGVTIMHMDEGLDTGPILAIAATPIGVEDTAGILFDRLAGLGADLLVGTLPGVLDGTAVAVPQDETQATLAPILTKHDGLVDWSRPAAEVIDRVRGVEPWPGAFTFSPRGMRLRVFPPLVPAGGGVGEAPGTVVRIDGDGMVVRTGQGGVRIAAVQPAGSRRMTPREAAAGRRVLEGDVLGDAASS